MNCRPLTSSVSNDGLPPLIIDLIIGVLEPRNDCLHHYHHNGMNLITAIASPRKYLSDGAESTCHHYKSQRSESKLRETFELVILL